jgi:hypothetical protein
MFGDYTSYQKWNTNKTTDFTLGTAVAGQTSVIAVKSANHQLFIQKIIYGATTAAAQAVTFRDSGVPLVIGIVPASQAGTLTIDYGPRGIALAQGKNLDISNTAGPGATIHIEAYEKIVNAAINVNSAIQ